MLSNEQGITLMELIIVLVIVGIAVTVSFSNWTTPLEQSRSANARNNLLAIYTAEQNFNNNNGGNGVYCNDTSALPCTSLATINSSLSLNIQDDGSYAYSCNAAASTCTATRTALAANNSIVLSLNTAAGAANPVCNLLNNWCPP